MQAEETALDRSTMSLRDWAEFPQMRDGSIPRLLGGIAPVFVSLDDGATSLILALVSFHG